MIDFNNSIISYATLPEFKLDIKSINFNSKFLENRLINLYEIENLDNYEIKISCKAFDDISFIVNSNKAVELILIAQSNRSFYRKKFNFEFNKDKYEYTLKLNRKDFREKLNFQALLVRKTSISDSKLNLATQKGDVLGHSEIYTCLFDEPIFNKKGNTPTEWKSFSEDDSLKQNFSKELFWNTLKKKKPIVYLNNDVNDKLKDILNSKTFGNNKKAILRDILHHHIATNFLATLLKETLNSLNYSMRVDDSNENRYPQEDDLEEYQIEVLNMFAGIIMEHQDSKIAKDLILEKIYTGSVNEILNKVTLAVSKYLKTNVPLDKVSNILRNEDL